MSVIRSSRIADLLLKDDPKELVYFKISNKPLIKIHRSVLIENSTVFKDAEEVTNDDPMEPIEITDTKYDDTHQAFLLFARCLYEKESASSLIEIEIKQSKTVGIVYFTYHFEGVYNFADKYNIQWLIDACKKAAQDGLSNVMQKYHLLSATPRRVLTIIQKMGLEEQLMSTFKKVKISFQVPEVNKQFKMCQEMGVDELTNQVVDFCCNLDFDPSWPPELSKMVVKRLKDHVDNGKLNGVLDSTQLGQIPK